MNLAENGIGPVGLAAVLQAVTGAPGRALNAGLTGLNLAGNQLSGAGLEGSGVQGVYVQPLGVFYPLQAPP